MQNIIKIDGDIIKIASNIYMIKNLSHNTLIKMLDVGMIKYTLSQLEEDVLNNIITKIHCIMKELSTMLRNKDNILPSIELYAKSSFNITKNKLSISSPFEIKHNMYIMQLLALQQVYSEEYQHHTCTIYIYDESQY